MQIFGGNIETRLADLSELVGQFPCRSTGNIHFAGIGIIDDLPMGDIACRHFGKFLKEHDGQGIIAGRKHPQSFGLGLVVDVGVIRIGQPGSSHHDMNAGIEGCEYVVFRGIRLGIFHHDITSGMKRIVYRSGNDDIGAIEFQHIVKHFSAVRSGNSACQHHIFRLMHGTGQCGARPSRSPCDTYSDFHNDLLPIMRS